MPTSPRLSVNIDHVATVRQARRDEDPDPIRAAHECEMGGAHGITVHLREDRRHIQDRDVERLRELVRVRLNFEMAATDEMVEIARRIKPQTAMLVPEGRDEVTTEGGLDIAGQRARMRDVVAALASDGIVTSAFLDAEPAQIEAAADIGFDVVEVHTGPYAHAHAAHRGETRRSPIADELNKVRCAGELIQELGMRFNAGHALNYHNVQPIAALPGVEELHIGHSIVSRALFTGIREATREMVTAIRCPGCR